MKPFYKLILSVFILAVSNTAKTQNLENAGEYMSYISLQNENISKKFLSYASASAHGKRARKVESLRTKLLDEVQEARMNISGMPAFKGDKSFRDTSVSFMKMYYNVLNDDYSKVLNMEEIAEQSYDEMEAFLLIKEGIDKKLEEGNEKINQVQKAFAAKNNITLVASTSALDEKTNQVHELNKYYNEIYLLFFKPYKQEEKLMEAVGKGNITSIEQTKNSMQRYATDGLEKLKTIKSFDGDNSVIAATKSILQFYVKEAADMSAISDYFLAKERFDAVGKEFEKKDEPTKADTDNYNKAVKEINKALDTYNQKNKDLNERRSEELKNWNKTVNEFFDEHTPRYK